MRAAEIRLLCGKHRQKNVSLNFSPLVWKQPSNNVVSFELASSRKSVLFTEQARHT